MWWIGGGGGCQGPRVLRTCGAGRAPGTVSRSRLWRLWVVLQRAVQRGGAMGGLRCAAPGPNVRGTLEAPIATVAVARAQQGGRRDVVMSVCPPAAWGAWDTASGDRAKGGGVLGYTSESRLGSVAPSLGSGPSLPLS